MAGQDSCNSIIGVEVLKDAYDAGQIRGPVPD